MATLLLLNGPNLDRLGTREPDVYGAQSLADLEATLLSATQRAGHQLETYQSNAEHELVNRMHRAADDGVAFVLINPAAFTHTSVALRDAMLAAAIPFIEIHITNPAAREPFRRTSYFTDIAEGVVSGFGIRSYELALEAALAHSALDG